LQPILEERSVNFLPLVKKLPETKKVQNSNNTKNFF
jgi:hypothetical protein